MENNIIVFGLDLNRSPGIAVAAGIVIFVIATYVALILRSRAKKTEKSGRLAPVVLVGGVIIGAAFAVQPLVKHYQWYDRAGEVKGVVQATYAPNTPKETNEWQFSIDKDTMDTANGTYAGIYRCIGDNCVALLPGKSIAIHCHSRLWALAALPSEECSVRR